MVVKFQNAGPREFSTGRSFNFNNLYQLNRGNDGQKAAQEIGQQAESAKTTASDALLRNAQKGSSQGNNDSMANAVAQAKNISNRAEGFDLANEAQKRGASAVQGGLLGFYGGGNAANQAVRKYGNLYQQLQGQQAELMSSQNQGVKNSIVDQDRPARVDPYGNFGQEEQIVKSKNAENQSVSGDRLRNMDTLEWGLKTGRLTQDQYARASQDDQYYRDLVAWLNNQ